ncbi:MAG: Leg1-related protein [Deltaproteobacteria bacterium]
MDPASVRDRHEMYRLLVERCNAHGVLGERHELSPFWGYDAQLTWQHASDRLGDATTDRIAPTSWWGACNFSLSVVPYAVASEHGLVPPAELDLTGYAAAVPHWHGAFHRMLSLDEAADLEPLRFAVWRAHLASITIAVERHRHAFAALPATEQVFARGWIRMVDLFGAAALRTDLEYLTPRPASLPSRILESADFSDLPRYEASTARRVIALGDRPAWRWPIELAMWKRMVRKREARDDLDAVMIELFGKSLRGKLRALRRAI